MCCINDVTHILEAHNVHDEVFLYQKTGARMQSRRPQHYVFGNPGSVLRHAFNTDVHFQTAKPPAAPKLDDREGEARSSKFYSDHLTY